MCPYQSFARFCVQNSEGNNKKQGISSFEELSRRPHTGKRLSDSDKQAILKAKEQYGNLSAKRIKELANLPYSKHSIYKVSKAAGLTKKRRKRVKTRNKLREAKEARKPLGKPENKLSQREK